jgi:hypothetical protein
MARIRASGYMAIRWYQQSVQGMKSATSESRGSGHARGRHDGAEGKAEPGEGVDHGGRRRRARRQQAGDDQAHGAGHRHQGQQGEEDHRRLGRHSVILSAAPGGSFRAVDILVDAGWLAAHRGDVVVADVRFYLDGRSTLDAYAAAHLPGAVYVDLGRDLSGPAGPRPPPSRRRRTRRRDGTSGIGDTTRRPRRPGGVPRADGVDAAGDGHDAALLTAA